MGDFLFKLVEVTKELEGSNLSLDGMLLTWEQRQEHIEVLKFTWGNDFNNIIDFSNWDFEEHPHFSKVWADRWIRL